MRVALLSRAAYPLHPPGGMERAVFHLAKHLQAKGVETILVTRPATEHASFPGRVVSVPYGGRTGSHGRVLDRSLLYPRFALRVGEHAARLVRANEVDLVHAQGLTALGYGRLRRRDPSLMGPLVMNPQGMEEHKTTGLKRLALSRLRSLSREAARLSDRVVATDEATRDEVPRLLGVEPSKVVVLPNGIDADELRRATPAEPESLIVKAIPALAGAEPLLLSVGRLEAYKGYRDVLAALASLAKAGALPLRWALVVVGEGPDRAALEKMVHGSHVHLPGRVSDALLHALYARADLFIHATRFEGSSLVTLEAMAHGLPVVATRAGGIPDKVLDQVTGLLVQPQDVGRLAEAIAEMVKNKALRKTMGERGREHALAHFSWPSIAGRTLALYEELLGRARP